jgi:hypothetical protein
MREVKRELAEFSLLRSKNLLITLHNLCVVREDWARGSDGSRRLHRSDVNEADETFERHVYEEYVASHTDHEGNKRDELTNKGIVRARSFFS